MEAIALDLGRSAVKIATRDTLTLFPTAVCPAIDLARLEIGDAAESARRDTVEIDGRRYFIGETALRQSRDKTAEGLRDDWIESTEHKALLKGAWQAACRIAGTDDAMLLLGLPSRLFAEQRGRLTEIAALTLHIPASRIRVVPQAFGAFMAAMLDHDAVVAPGRDPNTENWGVIDVGYYTTDFALMGAGGWTDFGAKSVGGTHRAAEHLIDASKEAHLKLPEAEEALRTKAVRYFGKVIGLEKEVEQASDRLASEIIAAASQVFGDHLPRLDGILVAGGGAELVASRIAEKWPHTETVPSPRYAVAEGMRRYGQGIANLAGG